MSAIPSPCPCVDSMLELVELARRAGLPHDVVLAGPVKMGQLRRELLPFFLHSSPFEVEELYVAGVHVVPQQQPGFAVGHPSP